MERRVEVLGAVRVRPDGPVVSVAASSLLTYLAVHGPARVGRDQVAFALWPDRSEDRARRALSDTIYRLRAASGGAPWLVADADGLGLDGVAVDLWEYRTLVARGADERSAAIGLHRGPLADGVDDEWLMLPRVAHDESVLALCHQICTSSPPADRLAVAERWVALDPFGTDSHRTLIETLLALDRRDAARRAVDRYGVVLEELGIDDADAVRWRALAADRVDDVHPFVGRGGERGRLVRLLDAAIDGRGGVAVVLGAPGIGKSRLLDELRAAARWRGVDVAVGAAEEFLPPNPFTPLDDALGSVFDPVRHGQAEAVMRPDDLHLLDRVLPGRTSVGHVEGDPIPVLVRAVRWLAGLRPLLLVLDDAQWCGPGFWPAVTELATKLTSDRVALVIAARVDDIATSAARSVVGELEAGGAAVIHLEGLTLHETEELLVAVGRPADDAVELHARSNGNPLVVMSGDDAEGRPDAGVDAERRIADVVRTRVAALTPSARRTLDQVSVLGRSVEYPVLLDATDGSAVDDLVELEVARLLRRTNGRLAFEHDLVRHTVLADIDPGALAAFHSRALAALERLHPDQTNRLLGHALGALDRSAVVLHSVAAGTEALDQLAYRAAEEHFGRALEAADVTADAPAALHAALLGRIQARDQLADRTGQAEDVQRLLEHAAVHPQYLGDAQQLDARYRFAVGDVQGALDVVEQSAGADVGSWFDEGVERVAVSLLRIAALALRELGRYGDATRVAAAASDAYEEAGDEHGAATMTDLLGGIAWRAGEPDRSAELHRWAADRFAAIGARGGEARALNNVGTALWALGDDRGAEEIHLRALEVCRSLEDRRGEGDNLDNLGGVAWVRGEYAAAIELYSAALAIRRATEDPWGVSISLSNLGDAHRALGEFDTALALIDESLAVNDAAGVVRNGATTLQSRGMVLGDLRRWDEARVALSQAAEAHEQLGDRSNLLETRAGLLDVAVGAGSADDANTLVEQLVTELRPDDPPRIRQITNTAIADTFDHLGDGRARHHAALAAAAMDEVLGSYDEHDAVRRRRTVPEHRRTVRAVERHGRTERVQLASLDAPLGTTLRDEHRVAVTWTIERPDDDLVPAGPPRRHAVLLRLLAEARAAGAVPTDEQLAEACGVNRRTILRDIDVLRSEQHLVATRGRRG